jgi:glycosyltransferase involved in cell wall biosynthesis/GT2 family glycosyltransferase
VPYALVDVELTAPSPTIGLGPEDSGVGIVVRRDDRVVGFALHHAAPGSTLTPATVAELVGPHDHRRPPAPADDGPTPSITVAVCTRDRPDLLGTCLDALLRQVDPGDVVVVDNAPTDDRTRRAVTDRGVRYELEPCPGLDLARNRALRAAGGDVVAFVDDDVVVDRHWFDGLRRVWREHPDAGAVTGQILPVELATDAQVAFERRGGFRGGWEQVRYAGQHLDGNPVYPYGPGMFGAGANLSVRRDVALRLGGFDDALDTGPPLPGGGDIDLLHRVVRAGHPLVYEPAAVVFHRHRRDAAGLRRQYDSWGRATMAFVTKTYRIDPPGRRKLRLAVRWFVRSQVGEVRRSVLRRRPEDARPALAELGGGVVGLLGTYGRSQRRMRRRRRAHGDPNVAILPWGGVVEDYLDPLGLTIEDYADDLSGGWLFGFVEALRLAGIDTTVVCWSRAVARPTRRIHRPSGATLWFLPEAAAHAAARSRLADPYAWHRRAALGAGYTGSRVVGALAHAAAPYLATPPRALARVLRQEGCRAVLCQEYEEGRFDVVVGLGRVLRVPVFATFQGGDHTRTPLERLVRPRTVRAAAGLVVASESEAERVRCRYGVADERIARIPNPFDPATVPLRPKAEARTALGIDAATRVAVWHGRVDVEPKGIDTLVEAWCEVRAACATPPLLLLVGTGSGAGWLHRRIDELGLDDVRWLDEFVLDRATIGTHLSAADVFVLPSRQEGFPVAPVEAMAAGLPVVATDAPGVRAVVGEGRDAGGVVVPRADARALAGQLRRFLDDPDLASEVGARAAVRVDRELSLAAVGADLRRFLLPGADR